MSTFEGRNSPFIPLQIILGIPLIWIGNSHVYKRPFFAPPIFSSTLFSLEGQQRLRIKTYCSWVVPPPRGNLRKLQLVQSLECNYLICCSCRTEVPISLMAVSQRTYVLKATHLSQRLVFSSSEARKPRHAWNGSTAFLILAFSCCGKGAKEKRLKKRRSWRC